MAEGKVTIFTGTGHGKSAAAVGCAVRSASAGQSVIIIQFLKGKGLSESEFAKRLEPEIRIFRFERSSKSWDEMDEEERQEAVESIRNGLHYAKKVLDTGECDLLVMDEVLGLVGNKIITVDELGDIVKRRGETGMILTGQVMDDRVCEFADEISEITTVHFKNF